MSVPLPRVGVLFALLCGAVIAPLPESYAQCDPCAAPATAVVAYQPVVAAAPVRSGWYPGRFLDNWAARRLARRSAAVAVTAAYAPMVTYRPVTAYQPVTSCDPCSGCATTYRPVSTVAYRSYVVPTTAYRPLVTTVRYAPVATTSAVCYTDACSTCSVGTSTASYSAPASSCCGVPSYESSPSTVYDGPSPADLNNPPQPTLNNGSTPYSGQKPAGQGENGEAQNGDEKNGAEADAARLRGPDIPDPYGQGDPVARRVDSQFRTAVYRQSLPPRSMVAEPQVARPSSIVWKSVPRDR